MHSPKPNRKTRSGLTLLLAAAAFLTGCGGYGPVSPDAYEYAKALYNIANRRAESRVASISEQIDAAHDRGEISQRETRWLQAIVDDARSGEWKDAASEARRIMEDQVHKPS